jgi:hypothetical protein
MCRFEVLFPYSIGRQFPITLKVEGLDRYLQPYVHPGLFPNFSAVANFDIHVKVHTERSVLSA